jgi:hypothetical protein
MDASAEIALTPPARLALLERLAADGRYRFIRIHVGRS